MHWGYKLLILLLFFVGIYAIAMTIIHFGMVASLSKHYEDKTIPNSITGATPKTFLMKLASVCPATPVKWEAKTFTNGTYCIEPESIPETDASGNLVGTRV